jgi:itaconyl-CoA hydratase
MSDDWRTKARKLPKGNLFDDFSIGQVFQHHWGRTLNEATIRFFQL